jgi:hypothetical protein
VDGQCVSLGAGSWPVLLQHGFFKRGTEQKLVCAKDSGEIALVPNLYGTFWLSMDTKIKSTYIKTRRICFFLFLFLFSEEILHSITLRQWHNYKSCPLPPDRQLEL